ncbi:MAG: nucleotidyltransferase domain-containing protein [Dehalococcoidia bacterium]
MMADKRLHQLVSDQPYSLLFATLSGAHLYGFPSLDSDYDLRGVHVLPLAEVIGLETGPETVEHLGPWEGLELDLVTHDARTFFRLMLKRNGYVLEQLLSPLVIHITPEHDELKSLASRCITRHHGRHYLGFARTQWREFERKPRVKLLLYVYRVLLTGIHLMRSGEIEANLLRLNEDFRLPRVDDLAARKLARPERSGLDGVDTAFHEREYERLSSLLKAEMLESRLPEEASAKPALDELLVRVRLRSLDGIPSASR